MDDPDREQRRAEFRLETIERRREQAATSTWAIPGLAIAGQAFLIAIAVDSGTAPAGRLLASLAGLFALLATAHLFAKQAYNFDVYEAVIERERVRVDLPGVQMDAFGRDPDRFPQNTQLVQRKWWRRDRPLYWLVVRPKAVWVWTVTLVVFLAVDVFLVAYSAWSVIRGDPGWFDPPT